MRIEVTQQDIEQGVQQSLSFCPVALAIKRVAGLTSNDVQVDETWIDMPGQRVYLPKDVEMFVERFDTGHTVEPFWFDLEEDEGPEPQEN